MKHYWEQGKQALNRVTEKLSSEFEAGFKVIKEVVDGLPVLVSAERSKQFMVQYDEKHYFVIPFALVDTGFILHTMRCLPDGVPEINDLPKRRVFHLPGDQYEALLRHHLVDGARALAGEQRAGKVSTLESLANDIDALDTKLTYGMLLVGGIAAFFNPLVGAGIAAKAMLPGIAGMLNKYGLRPVGEKLTQSQVAAELKKAEDEVLSQFSESSTCKVVNPILQELELALRTSEQEHDPLIDPNLSDGSIPQLDSERWRELTVRAMHHVYADVYCNKKLQGEAKLGPEDVRWLDVLFEAYHETR